MQRLVYAAVVIVAMIVPPLRFQRFKEALHSDSFELTALKHGHEANIGK
jgi:hypothetical protein